MVVIQEMVSITAMERTGPGNKSIPQIYGVGTDGYVYEWDYEENGWKPFTSQDISMNN